MDLNSFVPSFTYCLDKCHPRNAVYIHDGLEDLVSELPPSFTSRFGEIVWASGGAGFGFWPACIYDPCLVVGGARKLALKNLGKKHLVYFFECHEAPFSVLADNKIQGWEDGLLEEYDLGKVAKAVGKARSMAFEQALQAAIMENDKPIEYRLDWNHEGGSNFGDIKKAALLAKERTKQNTISAGQKASLNVEVAAPRNQPPNGDSCSFKTSGTKSSALKRKHDMVGCHVCKRDDDHAKLLLCEMCNDEYHIYCLHPPLKAVPEGDFYCGTNFLVIIVRM